MISVCESLRSAAGKSSEQHASISSRLRNLKQELGLSLVPVLAPIDLNIDPSSHLDVIKFDIPSCTANRKSLKGGNYHDSRFYKSMPSHSAEIEKQLAAYLIETCESLDKLCTLVQINDGSKLEEVIGAILPLPKLDENLIDHQSSLCLIAKLCSTLVILTESILKALT